MHLIQHFLHSVLQDLVIAAVSEQSHRNHNITFKGKFFLYPQKFIFEPCASAQGNDFVFSLHSDCPYYFLYDEMYDYSRIIAESKKGLTHFGLYTIYGHQ